MVLDELNTIEGVEFDLLVNLASDHRQFVRNVLDQPSVKTVLQWVRASDFSHDVIVHDMVVHRVGKILRWIEDFQNRTTAVHALDAALSAYLIILHEVNSPSVKGLAKKASKIRFSMWARQTADWVLDERSLRNRYKLRSLFLYFVGSFHEQGEPK